MKYLLAFPLSLALSMATICPSAQIAQAAEPAATPEVVARAKAHYTDGANNYQAGRYAEALRDFETAYGLTPLPDLLFNMSKACEKLGRYGEAAGHLQKYLEVQPTSPDRPQVEGEMRRLRQLSDAIEKPTQPRGTDLTTPPPVDQTRDKVAGWKGPPIPSLALAGGGVLFLVIGIGLGGGAIAAAKDVESGMTFDSALDSRGRSLEGAAIAFDVIGVTALAAGATWAGLWYFRDYRKRK